MQTRFRITPAGSNKPLDLDSGAVNKALPSGMHMEWKNERAYFVVETPVEEDANALALVQRELDRIFFLTCVRAHAEMIRRVVTADFPQSYWIHGFLPDELGPQDWTPELSLQLRLWSVAVDIVDPPIQLLIFFQIIELSYPDLQDHSQYPPYAGGEPDRRTEAKILRHIVAHASEADRKQTKLYLQSHQLGKLMANRSDANWVAFITCKVRDVKALAKEVIEATLKV